MPAASPRPNLRALTLLFALLTLLAVAFPARAAPLLLVDAQTLDVLYEQDSGQNWHPASLTKLMTAFVAFEAIAQGRVDLETPVVLSQNAVGQPPSRSGLARDSALSLRDALYMIIVKSANDVAVGIAETIGGSEPQFVAMMNEAAGRLGMTGTRFANPHGLHSPAQVTTARDMAILALYIRQSFPQYAPLFTTHEVMLGSVRHETSNTLLTGFAGATGMKTGYICASGLNIVATVDRNGRSLVAVVLGAGSARERNERAAELFLRGLSGAAAPTGRTVLALANTGQAAPDMRPLICGASAADYAAQREAEFPMGLVGQPSYLGDHVAVVSYRATDLGRLRNVPLPRHRPAYAPVATALAQPAPTAQGDIALSPVAAGAVAAPLPLPRPSWR